MVFPSFFSRPNAKAAAAGDFTSVLRRLPLRVVEVRGDGDDGLADLPAQVRLGRFLHLRQDAGADLAGRVLLALGFDPRIAVRRAYDLVGEGLLLLLGDIVVESTSDEPLGRKHGVLRVGDGLALGDDAHKALPVVGEGHHRGRGPHSLGVLDDLRVRALHHRDTAVCRTQVDTDDVALHL
ncbi:NAD-specific glutamate dehydrogenase, putative [Babesia ovata]|uniref:NAD-specific glutamate dehydrogenase, putative n=1 Tax=Babesia ovata TaxID=189622 RepID=A0A2H6KIH8_9APIC|nr:NAD-specific glutamate dehydrogenase, putative [Babesia ovata]GBE62793.1 NAD-specific glutamate dehydrogenase, putative [Babesia ovata]